MSKLRYKLATMRKLKAKIKKLVMLITVTNTDCQLILALRAFSDLFLLQERVNYESKKEPYRTWTSTVYIYPIECMWPCPRMYAGSLSISCLFIHAVTSWVWAEGWEWSKITYYNLRIFFFNVCFSNTFSYTAVDDLKVANYNKNANCNKIIIFWQQVTKYISSSTDPSGSVPKGGPDVRAQATIIFIPLPTANKIATKRGITYTIQEGARSAKSKMSRN